MNIIALSNQEQINFSMSLNVKPKKIKKFLGEKAYNTLTKAMPELDNLARDVDIYIKPSSWNNSPFTTIDSYHIRVKKQNLTLIENLKRIIIPNSQYEKKDFEIAIACNSSRLIDIIKNLKKAVLNS